MLSSPKIKVQLPILPLITQYALKSEKVQLRKYFLGNVDLGHLVGDDAGGKTLTYTCYCTLFFF